MKWYSHRVIGVSSAMMTGSFLSFADGGTIAAMVLAYLGSTLPDVVEGKPPKEGSFFFKRGMLNWRTSHRGVSHWFGWYITLAIAGWLYFPVLAWLGIGALSHLAADSLTPMGVPLYPFSKKKMMSFRLFATGSIYEMLFTCILMACAAYYATNYINGLRII